MYLRENPYEAELLSPVGFDVGASTLRSVTSLFTPPAPTRIAVPLC